MEINRTQLNQNLRLLLIGAGSIGKRHADVLYNALGMHQLTVYDPKKEAAEELAKSLAGVKTISSYEEGLSQKPDAVFILAPTALHIDYAIQALQANCHVMVEKPLDVNMDRIEELKKLAKEKKKMVSVAFSMRHHCVTGKIRQIIESGKLGKIISIRSAMTEYFPNSRPDYKNTHYVQYSGAFELIHAADLALFLAGGEPVNIMGVCSNRAELGFRSPDHVEAIFETDRGIVCNVTMSFCRIPGGNFIGVYGNRGSVTADYTHQGYHITIHCMNEEPEEINTDTLYRNMQFEGEDAEFLRDITSGIQKGCGIEDACRSMKVYTRLCRNGICENNDRDQK